MDIVIEYLITEYLKTQTMNIVIKKIASSFAIEKQHTKSFRNLNITVVLKTREKNACVTVKQIPFS